MSLLHGRGPSTAARGPTGGSLEEKGLALTRLFPSFILADGTLTVRRVRERERALYVL